MAENPEDLIVTDAELRRQLPALAEELKIGGSGSGIEEVSGTVTLDASGPAIREFWSTGATTFKANGADTLISSATGTVWRRTGSGSWGYQVVPDRWVTPTATPDVADPTWTATLTVGTPTDTQVVVTASALATDDKAVSHYEVTYNGTTWATLNPGGSTGREFTLVGVAGQTYTATKLRAVDTAGKTSGALTVPTYTMAPAPVALTDAFLDTFTRTAGALSAAPTPDLGSAWEGATGAATITPAGELQPTTNSVYASYTGALKEGTADFLVGSGGDLKLGFTRNAASVAASAGNGSLVLRNTGVVSCPTMTGVTYNAQGVMTTQTGPNFFDPAVKHTLRCVMESATVMTVYVNDVKALTGTIDATASAVGVAVSAGTTGRVDNVKVKVAA